MKHASGVSEIDTKAKRRRSDNDVQSTVTPLRDDLFARLPSRFAVEHTDSTKASLEKSSMPGLGMLDPSDIEYCWSRNMMKRLEHTLCPFVLPRNGHPIVRLWA